jgi:hypothetical protein
VRTGRDIRFATDDGLDARALGLLIKLNRSKKIAMIGHGHRGHLEFRRLFHQLPHPNRTVEQRILGVQVQVDERIAGHRTIINPVKRAPSNLRGKPARKLKRRTPKASASRRPTSHAQRQFQNRNRPS